jgi:hypothetical protein
MPHTTDAAHFWPSTSAPKRPGRLGASTAPLSVHEVRRFPNTPLSSPAIHWNVYALPTR